MAWAGRKVEVVFLAPVECGCSQQDESFGDDFSV